MLFTQKLKLENLTRRKLEEMKKANKARNVMLMVALMVAPQVALAAATPI